VTRGETASGGLQEPLRLINSRRECALEGTSPVVSTDTLRLAAGTSVI
jgi:hypothetical protein